jgi:hypothetical protein
MRPENRDGYCLASFSASGESCPGVDDGVVDGGIVDDGVVDDSVVVSCLRTAPILLITPSDTALS